MNDMFAKLTKVSANHGGPSVTAAISSSSNKNPLDSCVLNQFFDIGPEVASFGPELGWKIHASRRKSDAKESSVIIFDKRSADRLHKPRRKETISEVLRGSAKQLDRLRHPRLISIIHPLEENNDIMALASEPILGSLANILGSLDDRLPHNNVSPTVKSYQFLDFEIKYGILQISEAIYFLHSVCKLIHRFICPQSVLVTRSGTWKLAGFEFVVKCNNQDPMAAVPCNSFTPKLPKMAQPDLDFTAPEIQSTCTCSPQSDQFSFGLLIASIYNRGHSPLESQLSPQMYLRQLEFLSRRELSCLNLIDPLYRDSILALLELDPRRRPTSQILSTAKFLMDPGVHALQVLDVIHMKDSSSKMTFYHNLPQVMADIPKKMWFQHMIPSMKGDLLGSDVMGATLQPLLYMIENSTDDEYNNILFNEIRNILNIPRSVQASVTILENMDMLVRRSTREHVINTLLPMVLSSLDSSMPQIQNAAFHAILQVIDLLDETAIRKTIIPKAKSVFETSTSVQAQAISLGCLERLMENLDKNEIAAHIMPILLNSKLGEPLVLMPVIRMYKRMLTDKRFGLTIGTLASSVMPSLTPVIISPNLRMEEFNCLVELLQEMLEYVSRNQRNKLKLERLSMGSIDTAGMQLVRGGDSPIGYPHRPPCLRLENRRTSISVDDVIKRTLGSGSSSPDSNLLRVQAQLPGRRHSDNTIHLPRIQVNSSSPPSTGYSRRSSGPAGSSPMPRRHSQGTPGFQGYFAGISNLASGYKPNIDFVIPSYQRTSPTPGGRRYSAAPAFMNPGSGSASSSPVPPPPGSILQTMQAGMVRHNRHRMGANSSPVHNNYLASNIDPYNGGL